MPRSAAKRANAGHNACTSPRSHRTRAGCHVRSTERCPPNGRAAKETQHRNGAPSRGCFPSVDACGCRTADPRDCRARLCCWLPLCHPPPLRGQGSIFRRIPSMESERNCPWSCDPPVPDGLQPRLGVHRSGRCRWLRRRFRPPQKGRGHGPPSPPVGPCRSSDWGG